MKENRNNLQTFYQKNLNVEQSVDFCSQTSYIYSQLLHIANHHHEM